MPGESKPVRSLCRQPRADAVAERLQKATELLGQSIDGDVNKTYPGQPFSRLSVFEIARISIASNWDGQFS